MKDGAGSYQQAQDQRGAWDLIWKVQVPLKINTFVWKLLQDSLPTMLALKHRGISSDSFCPLCNSDEESSTHLFLFALLLELVGMVLH